MADHSNLNMDRFMDWATSMAARLQSLTKLCQQSSGEQRDCLVAAISAASRHERACTEAVHALEQALTESHKGKEPASQPLPTKWPLELTEYQRYGRQLIMPEIGLQGQQRLKASSVLVVGAGGLGCPSAAYLAGAGVGKIGVVDGDVVEASNLHRQIMHKTTWIGRLKVDSLIDSLKNINPLPKYEAHRHHLSPENALGIFSQYDVILDCTDHPTSRYLISDTAVLQQKCLVSASALRTEGQLMVLNHPATAPAQSQGGPCYRCIFPRPPPPESVVSCGEGGILGPVVGTMGVLQALEAIKLIIGDACEKQNPDQHSASVSDNSNPPTMLMFSALSSPQFRKVRLRGRRPDCLVCSEKAIITKESLRSGSIDYVRFCNTVAPIDILQAEERLAPRDFASSRKDKPPILLDVRDKTQFDLCCMPGSINVTMSDVATWQSENDVNKLLDKTKPERPIHVVCRLGNDSQIVVRTLKKLGMDNGGKRFIGDVRGGWEAYRQQVDPTWPEY